METSTHTHTLGIPEADRDFDGYVARINARFAQIDSKTQLFRVKNDALFEIYLAKLPDRQYHNCSTCRQFFKQYGGLVTITPMGRVESVLWTHLDDIPPYYMAAVEAVKEAVETSEISGVFYSNDATYGHRVTNDKARWTHYAVSPHRSRIYTRRALDVGQAIAGKTQDFETVSRALGAWRVATVQQCVSLLASGAIKSGVEKVDGNAKWLLELHRNIAAGSNDRRSRDNKVWAAIATAPAGFCHPRSSILGTLLDDLEAGKSAEQINRAFQAKTGGLVYQRPQAPPSDGTIAQAEKLFASMGLERSLARRTMRLEELDHALWVPKPVEVSARGKGIFDSLKSSPKTPPKVVGNGVIRITRVKFERDILPQAERIEAHVPYHGDFIGLVTAVHEDAPPLLQWDREEARNPVSWYVYVNGSGASQWRLRGGTYVAVHAITELPCHWTGHTPNKDDRRILILDGCKDQKLDSLSLFPSCLRGELHGVRSVIEAFSQRGVRTDVDGPAAAGIVMTDVQMRVHLAGGVVTNYLVDRDE